MLDAVTRATGIWAGLCAAIVAFTWGALATTGDWPGGLVRHLTLYLAAGLAWAAAVALLPRVPRARAHLWLVLAVSLAIRVPAWLGAPAHSDDVYRFLWDGHVQKASINPYLHPADAPELAPLRDANWARVNNRHLPTIYPPAAELAFRLAASLPLPPLAAWKLVVALADLALLALLVVWLRRSDPRGPPGVAGDPRLALAWGGSPLAAIELGLNGHMDVLGVAFLVAALFAHARGRRVAAGLWVGLSAAVKLLGGVLVPAFRSWRTVLGFAAALALAAAPYLGDGARLRGSLGEYSRRWRGNDGAFALLHAAATGVVGHTRFQSRHVMEGSPRLARLISGRDRDEVYPDEVANLAARAAAIALFFAALAVAHLRRLSPVSVASVALGAFLLLTPTLHPWYVLWVVPLIALGATPAWLVLAALAPLGYLPLAEYQTSGLWQEPVWTRLVLHGLTWALLLKGLIRPKPPVVSEDP